MRCSRAASSSPLVRLLIPSPPRCCRCSHGRRQELQQLRTGRDAAASFLLQCLAEARQEALADRGRAALTAAVSAASLLAEPAAAASKQEQQERLGGSRAATCPGQGDGAAEGQCVLLRLTALPPALREALLQQLLNLLGVAWQEQEGLALPSSGSPSTCSLSGLGGSPSWRTGLLPASCSLQSPSPIASGCCVAGPGGSPSEVLMQQLRSEVRPWGASSGGGAATTLRRHLSAASAASCCTAGRGPAKA